MSENETQETQEQPQTTASPKETAASGLLAAVAERVKGSNPEVQRRFMDTLVENEISSRVGLLDKGMQRRFQCLTELNKVNRPDVEHFDGEGKATAGHFTKERVKAIREAKEALGKTEKALEEALVNNNWQKLKELKG